MIDRRKGVFVHMLRDESSSAPDSQEESVPNPGGTNEGDPNGEIPGSQPAGENPAGQPAAAAPTTGVAVTAAAPEPKPYKEVVTGEAVTQPGLITVHQVGAKWYLELKPDVLGQQLIWYAEFAEAPYGVAIQPNALGARIVRWERDDKAVIVRDMTNSLRLRPDFAAATAPEGVLAAEALETVAFPTILYTFPVAAEGADGAIVVDVTTFFQTNLTDFDATRVIKAAGYLASVADPARSKIKQIRSFPQNLRIHTILTFPLPTGPTGAVSIGITHSLVRLPDPPMLPRYYDPRVGYFTTEFGVVSADDAPGIVAKQVISRFRLEKKNPRAKIAKPRQPIVFYVPPEVPEKWRPYVRQGVEDWQPAFEAAGFREAIIARDAPSSDEDPDWDPADARYSVIRWVPQPMPNAMGPHLADPRTGEIISAHVVFWDDVLKIAQAWYFTQVSAVDEQARRLPLPDEILGQVVRYIVCHEVGHAIGLRHNHRASQAYTTDQLRSPDFAEKHGPVASIMSYGRFNYVTQPGDGVKRLIPMLGPYDTFAINWGYRPIPDADSPDAEKETLSEWALEVKDNPWLAFGGEDAKAMVDPTVLTENIGADRIESARLGIANLERMLEYLVLSTTREHEDFELLDQMYRAILHNRTTWLLSAVKELGGVQEQRTLEQATEPFVRIPASRQRQVVAFLLENLRRVDPFLRPDIVNRVTPFNAIKPAMDSQTAVLDRMLAGGIYKQIMDATILEPEIAYPLADYLGDIQQGLFTELKLKKPVVDSVMRTLQRHYLTTMKRLLAAYETETDPAILKMLETLGIPKDQLEFSMSSGQGTDFRNAARTVLRILRGELVTALKNCSDITTKAHLEDLLSEADESLGMRNEQE